MRPKTANNVMPFGRYRGEPLGEIPTDYLDWLIGQDWMQEKPELLKLLEWVLESRVEWRRQRYMDD